MLIGPAMYMEGKLVFGKTRSAVSCGAFLPRLDLQMAIPPQHAIEIKDDPLEWHRSLDEQWFKRALSAMKKSPVGFDLRTCLN